MFYFYRETRRKVWQDPKRKLPLRLPSERGQVRTIIGGLSTEGEFFWTICGSTSSETVAEWLESARVNGLLSPGKVLVFDRHHAHTTRECREIMQKAGVNFLLTPPASSYFNPIERLWNWIKRKWRDKLAEKVARTENINWMSNELDII